MRKFNMVALLVMLLCVPVLGAVFSAPKPKWVWIAIWLVVAPVIMWSSRPKKG